MHISEVYFPMQKNSLQYKDNENRLPDEYIEFKT